MSQMSHLTTPATLRRLLGGLAMAAALTACGTTASTAAPVSTPNPTPPPAAGMCAEGVTDCVDTPELGGTRPADLEVELESARALLGIGEADLPTEVRIARRGEEQMMLTEDYVIGRMTVELDPAADGGYTVTTVTLELPDGPHTVSAAP